MLAELPQITSQKIDSEEALKIQGSLERKVGRGYNVLAEVDILLEELRKNREIGKEAKNYVLENELTAACEAVDSGRYFWSSFRPWNDKNHEFLAFGTSFSRMLRAGVDDMRRQISIDGRHEYTFELKRREVEAATEETLINLYQLGKLCNKMLLTISPYPEEINPEVASSLGYKPKDKLGKLRFEVFINNVRQTIELSVANGSLNILKKFVEQIGRDPYSYPNSTSFLEKPLHLGNSKNYLDTIINLAKKYDDLLEGKKKGKYYFCGQLVKNLHEKNYESIVDRQRFVREKGKTLVEWMYQVNLELAQSLYLKKPNSYVSESSQYWLLAKDAKGDYLLPLDQRMVLSKTITTNSMSRETAFILKKNELIRMWSVMACLINEERAKELFTKEQVIYFQNLVNNISSWNSRSQLLVDQMIAQTKLQFLVCGGLVQSFGSEQHNFFQRPLSQVRQILFGETRILCCTCPFCKEQVEAEIKNSTIKCPKCGKQAPYTSK